MLPTSCKNFRLIAFKLGHGRFKMGNTFLHNKNKICFLKKKNMLNSYVLIILGKWVGVWVDVCVGVWIVGWMGGWIGGCIETKLIKRVTFLVPLLGKLISLTTFPFFRKIILLTWSLFCNSPFKWWI